MGQSIYTERKIDYNLDLCDLLDFRIPRSNNGEIEWVVPEWVTCKELTTVVFKNFRTASADVRALVVTLLYTREIVGIRVSDAVKLTIQE